jgi:hypothetical protein
MAYGVKYRMPFISRKNISYYVDLLLKDHELDTVVTLTGAADPFLLNYESGDNDIINPIRASECTVNFYNDGATPLTTFYSEDDETWQIRLYCDDPLPDVLLWEGFLVQDDCREIFQDPPHIVQLKGTDNLALLKNVPFNEAFVPEITTISNIFTYTQGATTISDGRITLGITFNSSTYPPDVLQTGNSPYQDLSGFDQTTNNDRWILFNSGTEDITLRVQGIISVQFNDFGENYQWVLSSSYADKEWILVTGNWTAGSRLDLPFDITVTIRANEKLFPVGISQGDFNNSKTYFASTWTFTQDLETRTSSILDKLSLFDYIKFSLVKTGLSFLPGSLESSLPLTIYSNIYENSMPDRGDDAANEMFRQTHLFSGMFLSDDGTWANCYEILEKILFPLNATLLQTNGRWIIIRWPELRMFNNLIPGTEFDDYFNVYTGVTLAPNAVVAHDSPMEFINADATRSILRPYKNIKFTFNYEQPKSLIYSIDLKTTGHFNHTETIGTIRYDYYEIPSFWKHIDGDTSLIVVVTDTITKTETERYIYSPKFGDQYRFLRLNPIEVSQGDVFDFICSFRHYTSTSQDDTFSIRFLLITPNDTYYFMRGSIGKGSAYQPLAWAGPLSPPYSPSTDYAVTFIFIDGATDDSGWLTYSLTRIQQTAGPQYTLPTIPEDGVLLIDIAGGNSPEPSYADVEMLVKEMELRFTFQLNKSTNIIGQKHLNLLDTNIKNKLEEEINIDDAPRNSIAGALFTAAITTFGEGIGDIYFTKTKAWHRSNITETRRLGEITTMEREQIQSVPRSIMEGSIDCANPLLSIMNVLQIDTLPNLNFIFGVTEFNFMEGQFKATLWEIHAGEADATMQYTFEYIYKTS